MIKVGAIYLSGRCNHVSPKVPRQRISSGQALFTPLKLRSEGLVPASAAPCTDADFHFYLPRRRDSQPSCPLRSQEVRETLPGPRTPAPLANALYRKRSSAFGSPAELASPIRLGLMSAHQPEGSGRTAHRKEKRYAIGSRLPSPKGPLSNRQPIASGLSPRPSREIFARAP